MARLLRFVLPGQPRRDPLRAPSRYSGLADTRPVTLGGRRGWGFNEGGTSCGDDNDDC